MASNELNETDTTGSDPMCQLSPRLQIDSGYLTSTQEVEMSQTHPPIQMIVADHQSSQIIEQLSQSLILRTNETVSTDGINIAINSGVNPLYN